MQELKAKTSPYSFARLMLSSSSSFERTSLSARAVDDCLNVPFPRSLETFTRFCPSAAALQALYAPGHPMFARWASIVDLACSAGSACLAYLGQLAGKLMRRPVLSSGG